MKKALYLLCLIGLLSSFAPAHHFNSPRDYYAYNWRSFNQLSEVRQSINLYNVNHELLNAAIFFATNEARAKRKLYPLKHDNALESAARLHSKNMVQERFFDHYHPDNEKYHTPRNRVEIFDREFNMISENILYCSPFNNPYDIFYIERRNGRFVYLNRRTKQPLQTYSYRGLAREIVRLWINSKSHRKNVLSRELEYLGCGVYFTPKPYSTPSMPNVYATQNFGS